MKVLNRRNTILYSFILTLFFFGSIHFLYAAKAPSSRVQLEKIATHIVVGKVQAVYSYKGREGIPLVSGYEYDHKVAEVKIAKVEKGKILENLVYVRYWSRAWKGIGLPPPSGQSYHPQPKKGDQSRFYLSKNSFDGWTDQNQDGGYNIVYVNGVQPIK